MCYRIEWFLPWSKKRFNICLNCRDFVHICGAALELNGKLILPDQREYQEALRSSFRDLVNSLADILDDPSLNGDFDGSSSSNPFIKRNSVLVFTAIGGNGSTDA